MRTPALLLLLAPATVGQAPVRDLTPLLRDLPAKHKVPAVGLAIIRDLKLTGTGAAGVRRRGSEDLVTRGDRWHLGSCTKAMTATLFAVLREEGKVDFNTTLPAAFPDVRVHGGYEKARLLDLFTHRSGIRRDADAGDLWKRLRSHTGPIEAARRLVVTELLPMEPAFKVRARMNYSNAGYMVAGAFLERTLKTSWESAMRTKLLRPLGMNESGFGPPGIDKPNSQPWGHGNSGKPIRPGPNADNPKALGPAGTVHATLADWSKFIILHLREEDVAPKGQSAPGKPAAQTPSNRPKRLLSPASVRFLHQPSSKAKDYALGWALTRRAWAGGRTLVHSGSNTMWYCVCWLAPEEGLAVLATCNQGGEAGNAACDAACGAGIKALQEQRRRERKK